MGRNGMPCDSNRCARSLARSNPPQSKGKMGVEGSLEELHPNLCSPRCICSQRSRSRVCNDDSVRDNSQVARAIAMATGLGAVVKMKALEVFTMRSTTSGSVQRMAPEEARALPNPCVVATNARRLGSISQCPVFWGPASPTAWASSTSRRAPNSSHKVRIDSKGATSPSMEKTDSVTTRRTHSFSMPDNCARRSARSLCANLTLRAPDPWIPSIREAWAKASWRTTSCLPTRAEIATRLASEAEPKSSALGSPAAWAKALSNSSKAGRFPESNREPLEVVGSPSRSARTAISRILGSRRNPR